MPERKRYRAREGRILHVGRTVVTDDPRGTPLPASLAVQEHVRLGRLIEVPARKRPEARKEKD